MATAVEVVMRVAVREAAETARLAEAVAEGWEAAEVGGRWEEVVVRAVRSTAEMTADTREVAATEVAEMEAVVDEEAGEGWVLAEGLARSRPAGVEGGTAALGAERRAVVKGAATAWGSEAAKVVAWAAAAGSAMEGEEAVAGERRERFEAAVTVVEMVVAVAEGLAVDRAEGGAVAVDSATGAAAGDSEA